MPSRRRLDIILDEAFSADLDSVDIDVLRERRQLANDVENELSYYRRVLHGRLDLLRFEQRRRSGEEGRSLLEALPEILSDPQPIGDQEQTMRHVVTDLPPLPDVGRRAIDFVLGDDVLTRLDEIDDEGLSDAIDAVAALAGDYSEERHKVQEVADHISSVIAERYRTGQADRVGS
jgi:hypothetical protein